MANFSQNLIEVVPSPSTLVVEVVDQNSLVEVVAPQQSTAVEVVVQGPRGGPGAQGIPGIKYTMVIDFADPIPVWVLSHSMDRFPVVTCVDTSGDVISGDVSYVDTNTIMVRYGMPVAGSAYIN